MRDEVVRLDDTLDVGLFLAHDDKQADKDWGRGEISTKVKDEYHKGVQAPLRKVE